MRAYTSDEIAKLQPRDSRWYQAEDVKALISQFEHILELRNQIEDMRRRATPIWLINE